jgi:myosin-5
MPEGTLQLEHLMQATKLLQLKKVSSSTFDFFVTFLLMINSSAAIGFIA